MNRRHFVKYLGATTIYMGASSCASLNLFGSKYDEEVAREAWNKLANKGKAFEYVHPNKKLPNVLIYGDSISIGYTPTVRNELDGKANVFRFHKNGQSSNKFIPFMEKMKTTMFQPYLKGGWDFDWDVIHFNIGLHDLKYVKHGKLDKENGKQVNSIENYKENLHEICKYLMKEYPKAQLIFATTTAVPEEGAAGRFAGDSVKYNKVALEVLANYPSIQINDLYAFTQPHSKEWFIEPANVHYNDLGKTEQGKQVAKVIAENL
ncbi:SGNH/GDSL hydrolase family protein [Arenibacter sp. F26102]|uniref:SGNH/GDSL hydrolase family protein n=1 Tax=Arenibacter sp. F26102 TaxID=2926416 RepID=UPI001FF4069D|nr:SGNH/GDSL hydrolase family protein [Arenibacter sp. F26102]MCK0146203.1 SGNH/GDSL hydrolase family protein [Arenibacter sp. F26102]